MQPFRRYDSPWLDDPLQDMSPTPFSPPNMAGAWSDPIGSPSPAVAPQANTTPPRKGGITRESLAALKQAMVRIAPHLPPDLLRWHYINRLVQLSNPTPETLYPMLSYGSPVPTAGPLGGVKPSPLPAPNMPSATDNPFVRAAMERFTTSPDAERQVQPVRAYDTPLSIGDVISGIKPSPLSAPNMPNVMNDPLVRAARARLVTSPAANGHVQPIRADDTPLPIGNLTSGIRPTRLSPPNRPNVIGRMDTVHLLERPSSVGEPGLAESLVPLWGPGRAGINDFQNGDYFWATINAGLFGADAVGLEPLNEPTKAFLYGLRNGLIKGVPKALQRSGIKQQAKQLKTTVKRELSQELKGYWKLGSHDWDGVTSKWYHRIYPALKDIPVHHWLIPQRWESMLLPKWLINQPWNLLPMTRASEVGTKPRFLHDAVEGKGKENFQFDPNNALRDYYLRYNFGTPDWAKVSIPAAVVSGVGRGIHDDLDEDDNDKQ